MSVEAPYDPAYDPPAPVVPIRVVAPGSDAAALLPGLLDTGADCTLIPAHLASPLGLPLVGRLEIIGAAGGRDNAPVYAAHVEFAGTRTLARLVAYGDETIVGRDLLSAVVVRLDGPRLRLHVTTGQTSTPHQDF